MKVLPDYKDQIQPCRGLNELMDKSSTKNVYYRIAKEKVMDLAAVLHGYQREDFEDEHHNRGGATIVYQTDYESQVINVGFAVCHFNDIFVKKIGRTKAMERLVNKVPGQSFAVSLNDVAKLAIDIMSDTNMLGGFNIVTIRSFEFDDLSPDMVKHVLAQLAKYVHDQHAEVVRKELSAAAKITAANAKAYRKLQNAEKLLQKSNRPAISEMSKYYVDPETAKQNRIRRKEERKQNSSLIQVLD